MLGGQGLALYFGLPRAEEVWGVGVGGRFIVGSLFWVLSFTFYLLVGFYLCCQL